MNKSVLKDTNSIAKFILLSKQYILLCKISYGKNYKD